MLNIISLILNALLTSGMVVTLVTIRSTRKRANAEHPFLRWLPWVLLAVVVIPISLRILHEIK